MDAHSSLELLFDESVGMEIDLPPAVVDVYGSMLIMAMLRSVADVILVARALSPSSQNTCGRRSTSVLR